jgi:transposase
VPYARERLFKGGQFRDLADLRAQARRWCLEVAGQRVHGTTRRLPLVVFQEEERGQLLPYDGEPYAIPDWRPATVHPDHRIADLPREMHVKCSQRKGLRAHREETGPVAKHSTVELSEGCIVGLDISDRQGTFVVLADDGRTVEEGTVPMTKAALNRWSAGHSRCRIALETGTHSPWVSRTLAAAGHEVIVANARQLPLIFKSNRKNDRLDALSLAKLARLDRELLHPITHRTAQAQQDLALLHARNALVQSRAALINHVRGVVKAMGERLPACSAEAFVKKAEGKVPAGLEAALAPVLTIIAQLTEQITGYNREVDGLASEHYPAAASLRQVNGVGPLTSLAYVITLEDPLRFRRSRDVGPYLGLTPRRDQSGSNDPQLHITKAGDVYLRKLLTECAHYILGPFGTDCDLRRWGLKLAGGGSQKARKRAITAVARKLAVLLHRLWVTGEVYEPLRLSQPKESAAA